MSLAEMLAQVRSEFGLQVDFSIVLLTVALLLARILPTILLTPMVGGDTTPTEVKLGLGLLIALVMFPQVSGRMQFVPVTVVPFVMVLLKEAFVGFCISYIVGAVFHAAEMAGQLIDHFSGSTQAQINVPAIGHQVTLYAALKLQLVVVLFLTLNGHHLVIYGIAESLGSIPLDTFPQFSHGFYSFFQLIIRISADMLRVAMALSAPVMMATLLADLGIGLINKVAPQIQISFVGGQIKPGVTAMIVFASLHLILDRVTDEFRVMFQWLKQALWLLS